MNVNPFPIEKLMEDVSRTTFKPTFVEVLRWPPGRYIAQHRHGSEYHLDLFRGNGEMTLGQQRIALAGWMVVFIPPSIDHSFTISRIGKLRSIGIKFQTAGSQLSGLVPVHFHPQTQASQRATEMTLQRILEEWQMRDAGWDVAISARIRVLLMDVLRFRQDRDRSSSSPGPIGEACRYMSLNYNEPITLTEVAGHCKIHPASLSRLFRQRLGTSPRDYLLRIRLRQACLLLNAGHTATETAEQVGFSSIHYFSRAFKKAFHLSPTLWLNQSARHERG